MHQRPELELSGCSSVTHWTDCSFLTRASADVVQPLVASLVGSVPSFAYHSYHNLELYQLYIVAHKTHEAHRLVLNFQVGCVCRTPERQCSLLLQGKQQEP